jgi:hypothetical protein
VLGIFSSFRETGVRDLELPTRIATKNEMKLVCKPLTTAVFSYRMSNRARICYILPKLDNLP